MSRLEELFPTELEARLAEMPALLIPVGTIEWHGHHLPLGLDVLKAGALAEAASERCGAVIAPPTWLAAGGVPFPHTLKLPAALVEPLLTEAVGHFTEDGFRVVCLVNGHYGLENTLATKRAAANAMRRADATVLAVADYELLIEEGARGDHAGEWESAPWRLSGSCGSGSRATGCLGFRRLPGSITVARCTRAATPKPRRPQLASSPRS